MALIVLGYLISSTIITLLLCSACVVAARADAEKNLPFLTSHTQPKRPRPTPPTTVMSTYQQHKGNFSGKPYDAIDTASAALLQHSPIRYVTLSTKNVKIHDMHTKHAGNNGCPDGIPAQIKKKSFTNR